MIVSNSIYMSVSESILSESILCAIKNQEHDNREIYTDFIEIVLHQCDVSAHATVYADAIAMHTLKKPMSYPDVEILAFQLSLQLQHLERKGFSLLFWQPSDILVVQLSTATACNKLYILANLSQCVPLLKKDVKQLILVYPTVYPLPSEWCAPELLKINVLPFVTQRSASYYSLALVCLSVLDLSLEMITDTKLFYFLERCLKPEPKERELLYL
jgi:hypothetical protein